MDRWENFNSLLAKLIAIFGVKKNLEKFGKKKD